MMAERMNLYHEQLSRLGLRMNGRALQRMPSGDLFGGVLHWRSVLQGLVVVKRLY